MKHACGIVLYNPSNNDIENVVYYSNIFNMVFLYCNSVLNDDVTQKINTINNICLLGSGNNDGLSIACEILCEAAKQNTCNYIMLFDQDSRMGESHIREMLKYAEENNIDSSKVAIFCPQIVLRENEPIIKSNKFVDWCITSGSLIDLSVFNYGINFDKSYFIDRVDIDFCKQITLKGFKILNIGSVCLMQELGEHRKVFGMNHYEHSPIRHYYIARNRMYYNKKYGESRIVTLLQIVRQLFEIVFFEHNKIKKVTMVKTGIDDYRAGRMGAYSNTTVTGGNVN